MVDRLKGKRVLITQADDYMGPDFIPIFEEEGATVIADTRDLTVPSAAKDLIVETGHIDVLVANLAAVHPRTSVENTTDEIWSEMFDKMVHPLHRLVRATIPQMKARRSGKIVVMGSASPLRGQNDTSPYASARGAQLAYVKTAGFEVASYNVQINVIAQTFVENERYFSKEYQQTDGFKEKFKDVPLKRLSTAREDAMLAIFLASEESNSFVGQAFPFAAGWVV
ncbi:MAG: short-chain dehydrogenase [Dehalococcoidia bacterium]|nr:short-chain dehydrogenase [Dehalococcoidia bacterium]